MCIYIYIYAAPLHSVHGVRQAEVDDLRVRHTTTIINIIIRDVVVVVVVVVVVALIVLLIMSILV